MTDKKIFKYVVSSDQSPSIPRGGIVLSAHGQGNSICIWVEVDTKQPLESRHFEVFGTGHSLPQLPKGISRKFIGTALVDGGVFVFHVYEKIDETR